MTIRSAAYYWVECNCCEERADYMEFAAWDDSGEAVEQAESAGFMKILFGTNVYDFCSECWSWPEDMPGYDEATNISDDPVRKHEQHPTKGGEISK